MKQDTPPQTEALSIDDVGRIAGIGRTTIYKLINSGALPARKLGRRTLVMRSDLTTCLDGLPKAAQGGMTFESGHLSSKGEVSLSSQEALKVRLSRTLKRRSTTRP